MIDLGSFLLTVMWGITIGCVYVLLATGLNLIFGVMKLVNFAHGELLVLGAYMCYSTSILLGVNVYLALLVSVLIVAIIGVVIERMCFRRVTGKNKLNEIFMSLGLIYIIDHVVVLLWGDKSKRLFSPFEYLTIPIGDVSISYDWLIAMIIVSVILASFFILIKKTRIGLAMRATSQDSETSMLMGVDTEKIYMLSFGLGAALAGASGALYGIMFPFNPYIGSLPTIKAFAIIILGGLGSIPGAVVGGLLYGIAEQTAASILGGIWRNAIAFALLIIALVIRPTGIFGEKEK